MPSSRKHLYQSLKIMVPSPPVVLETRLCDEVSELGCFCPKRAITCQPSHTICSYWSSVTPAEVLIAIHDINPEKDKVPLKKDNTPTKVCTGVTSYKVDNIEKSMDNIASSENDPKVSS
ncbi:hypothetical protein ZWY2020_027395 [Hordeum vulgare]|nr:hypothetical protein ZWY2020_027395 [Hordeum vulgare]